MKNKSIKIIVGSLVIAGAVGVGVVVGKVINKEQPPANNVSEQKDTEDNQASNNVVESKDNDDSKDATMPSTTNDKTPVSNNEKPKTEANLTNKNDSSTSKEEPSNGVYKADVSETRLKEVKDNYYKNAREVSIEFGRHFEKTGDLLFPDEKESNNSYTKNFYDIMDKNLNELWSDLKTILSESEMKKLTQEQVQWIKEKDSIKREETPILTAEANTMYARGQQTYKRCIYLANKYLNY